MKIAKYNIFIIALMLSSCMDKQNQGKNDITIKPIILEYKSQLDEYYDEKHFDIQPIPKSLYIKKIIYPKKMMYLYKYKSDNYVDSLVFFHDSVKMNDEKLLLISERLIPFEGKSLEIKKYQYLDRSSNLFINDSLGLIMQKGQTHPYGTVVREYNSQSYREVCNKIIKDSLFFSFKFNFKYLKK